MSDEKEERTTSERAETEVKRTTEQSDVRGVWVQQMNAE